MTANNDNVVRVFDAERFRCQRCVVSPSHQQHAYWVHSFMASAWHNIAQMLLEHGLYILFSDTGRMHTRRIPHGNNLPQYFKKC